MQPKEYIERGFSHEESLERRFVFFAFKSHMGFALGEQW